MKKAKKIIITTVSVIVLITIGIFIYYHYFYDANRLTLAEQQWLDNNKTNIISFNLPNDLNVFAKDGEGVFNSFIDDFAKNYSIEVNKNIANSNTNTTLGLTTTKEKTNDLLLFQDHYVIVSKKMEVVTSPSDLKGKTIGVLSDGMNRFSGVYNVSATFITYDNRSKLLEGLKKDESNYIIVPLNEYLDSILENNYSIVYHLSDLKINYYIHFGSVETLNNIVRKYYNEWLPTKYENYYYKYLYNLFIEKLNLTDLETDSLTSKTYTFGFVPSTPYGALSGNKYGGIVLAYLTDFSKFSKVDFTYTKYKNDNALVKAYNNKELDLIFNNTSLNTKDYLISTNINCKYYLISSLGSNIFYNNINEVQDKVFVLSNSSLSNYLSTLKINIQEVDSEKSLIKAFTKGNIIAIDANTYNTLVNTKIKNSYITLTGYTKDNFSFKYQKQNDAFNKLFTNYINYLDQHALENTGIISFKSASTSGSLISTIAKYILLFISVGVVITGVVIFSKKHLKLDTKIRKEEKLKFIDMLTSLKNRNYLNEKIEAWNQNTIYPQAVIIIDLNNIKYLNDTFGHEEGDNQIKSAANALIKTQLDNSEIMRTDGNEFMVYLVGYNEKQVINYIKKLVKEFKDLPYEYGAAIGFSMIVDDLKLLDDAINEATIQMRNNKEAIEGKDVQDDNEN